jgi:predicted ATP-dependent endonuclease of OLD family
MLNFDRTISGKISKFLFYDQVLVWVEGKTDIPFYQCILKNQNIRFELTTGKTESQKIITTLIENDFPFVVILDGDYDILQSKKSKHRRVILLHRYSFENYLFELEPIKRICSSYTNNSEINDLIEQKFNSLNTHLRENLIKLLILDIVNYRLDLGIKLFPNKNESLMESRSELLFSSERIENCCQLVSNEISQDILERISKDIDKYLENGRFADLIRGHFIFGLIRDLIISVVKKGNEQNPNFDNVSLILLLSEITWNHAPSNEHRNLRRRIVQAVNEVARIKTNKKIHIAN